MVVIVSHPVFDLAKLKINTIKHFNKISVGPTKFSQNLGIALNLKLKLLFHNNNMEINGNRC